MLHIYTTKMQPATGWTDWNGDEPVAMGFEPDRLIYTECCHKQRKAEDCVVQCYYDGLRVWCAPDRGCQDPQFIAEKKARAFRNRSEGQKKRWRQAARQ